MKQLITLCLTLLCMQTGWTQLISADPFFPNINDDVTIYFDASQGNAGLANCNCDVYVHTGVITNLSTSATDWKHVTTTWGTTNAAWKMTPVAGQPNLFSWVITPSIGTYYSVPNTETVQKLAFVFRNGAGDKTGKSADGTDIYYDVYPANAGLIGAFVTPNNPVVFAQIGEDIPVKVAVSSASSIELFDDGITVASATTSTLLNHTITVSSAGSHLVEMVAFDGAEVVFDEFTYFVPEATIVENPPAGAKLGANCQSDGSVILTFDAPNKDNVFVLGSFNDYQPVLEHQMKRSVDGNTWWVKIENLNPDSTYLYQYMVNGTMKVADPLSELVLQNGDNSIPAITYPNMPQYPSQATNGTLTILRPCSSSYDWQDSDWVRPAQTSLVIYEMLVRDFIQGHDYQRIIDTLDYFVHLGVNAIELMPVQEFEGNSSWGYNPSYHRAMDKYYGTPDKLRELIDKAHQKGIAVIADVVFNHAFGQSPLCNLYWDAANNRPSADNPWLNPEATHPFNVGYDFNHESTLTKNYVKRCLDSWLTDYHFDGFRFDLSKGFTQTDYGDNVSAWSGYDAGRIAILKDYADYMWAVSPNSYVILEHLGGNQEEKELANYGMMLWGNMNYNYGEASMGFVNNNIYGVTHKSRSFTDMHLVGYMESHDEERMMYRNLKFGNSFEDYSIKDTTTALQRVELASAMFYTVPGPKMLWQFGELGYDYNIDYNGRVGEKPIRWDYYSKPNRKRLHDVVAALIHLRTTYPIFQSTDFQLTAGNNYAKKLNVNSSDMNVTVVGNFDVKEINVNPTFQHTGWWYNYFSGDSINVTNTTELLELMRGEYRIYTDQKLPEPSIGYFTYVYNVDAENLEPVQSTLNVFPNPTSGVASIEYQLDKTAQVQVAIFNVLGEHISTLLNARTDAGSYKIQTPVLSPGTYFVRTTVDGFIKTRTLIVQ